MTHPSPPLPWLLAYRLFGLRLPAEYRPWVAADTSSRMFLTWRIGRSLLWFYAFLGVYFVIQSRMHEPPVVAWSRSSAFFLVALIGSAVCLLASGSTLIRRTLRWQRVDRHGRPTGEPKGLARFGNPEALVAGLLALSLLLGGSAVFAYGLRPTTRAQPCEPPDDETIAAIKAGLTDSNAELLNPRAVPFSDMSLVASHVKPAGEEGGKEKKPEIGLWLVTDDGTIYELRGNDTAGKSTFPRLGEGANTPNIDRVGIDAIRRIGECLAKVTPK